LIAATAATATTDQNDSRKQGSREFELAHFAS
jgi:hypothetical protein